MCLAQVQECCFFHLSVIELHALALMEHVPIYKAMPEDLKDARYHFLSIALRNKGTGLLQAFSNHGLIPCRENLNQRHFLLCSCSYTLHQLLLRAFCFFHLLWNMKLRQRICVILKRHLCACVRALGFDCFLCAGLKKSLSRGSSCLLFF